MKTSFGNKAFLMAMIIASSLLLSACAGANYSKLPPVPTNILPEAPVAKKLPAYRAQIGDVLEFKFYLNPEFDETVTVRPDGMISTNVMEDLYVYDQSIKEINKQVRKHYSKELKDPKVKTIVRSFAPIRIYVSGEVASPGEFIVVGQALTLTQAIARAGGIKNSGDASKVLIIRRGAGEEPLVFHADYDAATQKGDAKKDARLAPSDVVFVPKSGAALAYKNYQQYVQQYVNPSVGASYSIGGD